MAKKKLFNKMELKKKFLILDIQFNFHFANSDIKQVQNLIANFYLQFLPNGIMVYNFKDKGIT